VKISFRFPHSRSSNATRHHRRRSLVLACAAIAVLPLAWRGTSCGHDFDFHLQSWLEVLKQWHEGVLYPHWNASANYGAGEPRFVFYPPATWIVGALLGTVLPWSWTPLAFTLLALFACGLAFFMMASEWMTEDASAIATCIYILNPYLLFVAYERTAYGELLSAIWVPLLVLYGLRKQPSLLPLSLIVAALWLTNAPSAVMGCYLLALLTSITAVSERSYALVLRAAGAVALGIGLAAFYIVPAAYEQRWVEIARAIAPGMRIEDSFLFGHTGEGFHDQVLRTASWIAVAMLMMTALAAWRSWQRSRLWPAMTATAIAVLILLLPFSDFFWKHTPELKFLQFPWRLLLALGLVMSILIGSSLHGSFRKATTRKTILIRAVSMLLLAGVMSSVAAYLFWQPCDDEDNIAAQRTTFHSNGFEGTDEYTSLNADNGDIQQGLPQVRVLHSPDADVADSSVAENPQWTPDVKDTVHAQIEITRWQTEHREVVVTTSSPAYAVFQLMDYPAWRVEVNGKPVSPRLHRDDGLLTIPLNTGGSAITIDYSTTRDVELGRALTLLALCILTILFLQTKRRRTNQLS
jgi:hypothetical protein